MKKHTESTPNRKRDAGVALLLFALAFALRLIFALRLAFPPLDDPAFYIQTARNLAAGRGLTIDVIWNYSVPFAPLAIWFVLWSYLLIDVLQRFETSSVDRGVALWPWVVLIVVVTYGSVQLIKGLMTEARTDYVPLQAEAGTVRWPIIL